MEYFNTRELASITWFLILVGYPLRKQSSWLAIIKVVRSAITPKLLVPFLLLTAYTIIIVTYLYLLEIWETSQLKETVYWYLFGGAWVVFGTAINKDAKAPFKSHFKGLVGIAVLLEFVTGFRTFNYFIELLLVGIIIFFTALSAISTFEEKHAFFESISQTILAIIGLLVISYGVAEIVSDFEELDKLGEIRTVMLPIVLGVLYVPAIYLLMLYSLYEENFLRVKIFLKDSFWKRLYARIVIINECHFSPRKLRICLKEHVIHLYSTADRMKIYEALKIHR